MMTKIVGGLEQKIEYIASAGIRGHRLCRSAACQQ
jgi:hypothetical protein